MLLNDNYSNQLSDTLIITKMKDNEFIKWGQYTVWILYTCTCTIFDYERIVFIFHNDYACLNNIQFKSLFS